MHWQLKAPVHQQAWHWPEKPEYSVPSITIILIDIQTHIDMPTYPVSHSITLCALIIFREWVLCWRNGCEAFILAPHKWDIYATVLTPVCNDMMTSSNENIFRVTGLLCGEFTGPGEFPTQRPVTRRFGVFFLFCFIRVWINGWVNNREAGDLRRYRAHFDVTIMN